MKAVATAHLRAQLRALLRMLLFATVASMLTSAAAGTMSESDFKATLLYNILQFVRWAPGEGATTSALRVCTFESGAFATPLANLAGKTIQGRALLLREIRGADEAVRQCDCLWLDRDALNFLDQVALLATRYPLLIVAEGRDAVARGAAIGVVLEGGHAHLAIGPRTTRHADIEISARLQQMARERP